MNNAKELESLLPHSRIATLSNGRVTVNHDNLKKILSSVAYLDKDVPVAIVAVNGAACSGKSFMTNLFIQYLENGGEECWLSDIIDRTATGQPMMSQGYSWGIVNSSKFYAGDEEDTSGIYLWPQPYFNLANEEAILIFVLHMNITAKDVENVEPLEHFLALACSKIMELIYEETKKIPLLDLYNQALKSDPVGVDQGFCKRVSIVIRSRRNACDFSLTNEHAKDLLLNFYTDSERKQNYKNSLAKFHHLNLAWLKDLPRRLNNRQGVLKQEAFKSLFLGLKQFVTEFFTEDFVPKTTFTGKLLLGDVEKFICSVAEKVNLNGVNVSQCPNSATAQLTKIRGELESLQMLKKVLEQNGEPSDQVDAEGKVDNDGVLEQLKCPVCFEVYQDKIFLCVNGHALCDTCFQDIQECPACRVSMTNSTVRCRPMEAMVSGWKLDCPYRGKGCKETLVCKQMPAHVDICAWGRKSEQQCQIDRVDQQIEKKQETLQRLELKQMKANVLQRCREMLVKAKCGQYSVESEFKNELLIRRIIGIRNISEQTEKATLDNFLCQIYRLDKIEEMYEEEESE